MKKALRIYMPHGAKIKQPLTFWQRLWNPSLSSFLLKKAKEDGLEQAVFLNVSAGYLKGKKLSYGYSEAIPKDFPLVLEIIDDELNLRNFYKQVSQYLLEYVCYISLVEDLKKENFL